MKFDSRRSSPKVILAGILISLFFGARIVVADSPFSVYSGNASKEEEIVFLDNFAIYLTEHPEMVGYIAYFSSEKRSASRLKKRVNRAVKYLSERRGIDIKRLIVIYGGRNERSKVVLQPTPQGAPPPYTSPAN